MRGKKKRTRATKKNTLSLPCFFLILLSTHRRMRFRGVPPKARWPRDLNLLLLFRIIGKENSEFFKCFSNNETEEKQNFQQQKITCRRPQERVPEEPEDVRRRRGVQHPARPNAGHELPREIKDGKLGHAAERFFIFFWGGGRGRRKPNFGW